MAMTQARKLQNVLAYPPRAMKAERAAAYLVSRSKFLDMVDANRLPKPYREIAPHTNNTLLNELVAARSRCLLAGLDQVLASLQPRPAAIAALNSTAGGDDAS
jgi:hypothetical protein